MTFAGALRRSELCAIEVEHIRWKRRGFELLIPHSKTDPEAEGDRIVLTSGEHAVTCPVRALRAWLTAAGINQGAIFRAITRHGTLPELRPRDRTCAPRPHVILRVQNFRVISMAKKTTPAASKTAVAKPVVKLTAAAKPTRKSAASTKAAPPAPPPPPKPTTVTLKQLAVQFGESQNLPAKEAQIMLDGIIGLLVEHLKAGDKLRLSGLGILEVKDRPSRMGRNPATGATVQIAASRKIAFRPAKELKDAI